VSAQLSVAQKLKRRLAQVRSSKVCQAKAALGLKDTYPVQSVSIPRCGHHMTVRFLCSYRRAMDPRHPMTYCEFYHANPGQVCCKAMPCVRPGMQLQKSHDFSGQVPILRSRRYIIQVRDPLPSVISHFEYLVRVKRKPDTAEAWMALALAQVDYLEMFLNRWVVDFPEGIDHLYTDYDDLMRDPSGEMERLVAYLWPHETPNHAAIQQSLSAHEFRPTREVEAFRYYEPGFISQLAERLKPATDIMHRVRRTQPAPDA